MGPNKPKLHSQPTAECVVGNYATLSRLFANLSDLCRLQFVNVYSNWLFPTCRVNTSTSMRSVESMIEHWIVSLGGISEGAMR